MFVFIPNASEDSVLNTFENIMENGAIFHNIFKYIVFQRRQKALLWSKGLKSNSGIWYKYQNLMN